MIRVQVTNGNPMRAMVSLSGNMTQENPPWNKPGL
jgi:hypothetical protein